MVTKLKKRKKKLKRRGKKLNLDKLYDDKQLRKQGYFNEVALAFMEKVLDASGLADKVRVGERERREKGGRERGREEDSGGAFPSPGFERGQREGAKKERKKER